MIFIVYQLYCETCLEKNIANGDEAINQLWQNAVKVSCGNECSQALCQSVKTGGTIGHFAMANVS